MVLESVLEAGYELAAEYRSKHLDGEKEVGTGSNPVGVIECKPSGRDYTVDVGMEAELLIAGVQPAEEADLCAEMSGVAGDLEKRFCTGAE